MIKILLALRNMDRILRILRINWCQGYELTINIPHTCHSVAKAQLLLLDFRILNGLAAQISRKSQEAIPQC